MTDNVYMYVLYDDDGVVAVYDDLESLMKDVRLFGWADIPQGSMDAGTFSFDFVPDTSPEDYVAMYVERIEANLMHQRRLQEGVWQ